MLHLLCSMVIDQAHLISFMCRSSATSNMCCTAIQSLPPQNYGPTDHEPPMHHKYMVKNAFACGKGVGEAPRTVNTGSVSRLTCFHQGFRSMARPSRSRRRMYSTCLCLRGHLNSCRVTSCCPRTSSPHQKCENCSVRYRLHVSPTE